MRKTLFMIGIVSLILIGLCLPAQATELLRLEAHWAEVYGWEHCGKPVEGLLKVQGPAYVKRVSYEDPYTPLNFIGWDPVGAARVTREGDPRNDDPGVVLIYSKCFQDGKEVRNFRSTLLRREALLHFTENEVYYYKVWIGSPCVRQSGGGQQRQDVLVTFKTQAGPDHIPESDDPPFETPPDLIDGTGEPKPVEKPPVPGTQPGNTWAVNFNGYPGAMEISGSGGSYAGRFNLHGNWEDMLDLRIEGSRISFRRAGADQRYEGTISGNSMSGNFSQGGSGSYPWRADLKGGSTSSLTTVPTYPRPALPVGTWAVNFNGYPGVMEISVSGGSYAGRFNLHSNWEDMLDLRIEGGRISFRRAAADQRYEGAISGNSMSGTFSQGGSGSYPWMADYR